MVGNGPETQRTLQKPRSFATTIERAGDPYTFRLKPALYTTAGPAHAHIQDTRWPIDSTQRAQDIITKTTRNLRKPPETAGNRGRKVNFIV